MQVSIRIYQGLGEHARQAEGGRGGTGYPAPDKDFIFGRPLAALCVCFAFASALLCSAVLRAFSKQTQIVGHMSGVMKFTLNVHTEPHTQHPQHAPGSPG